MIDLLLVDPKDQAEPMVRALVANNVSYQIVKTYGHDFAYSAELNVIDLSSWDSLQTYTSAVAWTLDGQQWLDTISNQIVLNNRPIASRKEYYLTNKFEVELGTVFNILSYKGRHVLIDASVYKDAKWNLILDHSLPLFVNGVETAFAFLDSVGILNGPSQVFIKPNGSVLVRMVPKITTTKVSTRNFLDIWPYVLTLEVDQPKKTILAFYSWVERTGSAKQFQFETGL
jgi:hypothetical protein